MFDGPLRRVVTTLVAALLALLALSVPPVSAGSSLKDRIDPRLDAASCSLLGRLWSEGIETTRPGKRAVGCRIDACVDSRAHIRALTGEEVCYFGDERTGPRYGTFVDARTCEALNRRWVPEVNMCASNPFRGKPLIEDDPACGAGTPYYLTLRETEGYFDECLSQARLKLLTDAAQHSSKNLRQVAIQRSVINCGLRPDSVYTQDECVPRAGTLPRSELLIEGESVLWRAQDELETLRPTWTMDGLPGRQLADLADRIQHDIDTHGAPRSLIVALGTNPTPGYTRADASRAIGLLRKDATVMFVLPYRVPGSQSTLDSVARYRAWETQMAQQHPATRCIADWPSYVEAHPGTLVDGIHPTSDHEITYATFISDSWDTCEQQFAANATS